MWPVSPFTAPISNDRLKSDQSWRRGGRRSRQRENSADRFTRYPLHTFLHRRRIIIFDKNVGYLQRMLSTTAQTYVPECALDSQTNPLDSPWTRLKYYLSKQYLYIPWPRFQFNTDYNFSIRLETTFYNTFH